MAPGVGLLSISKIQPTRKITIEPLSEKSVYNYPNPFSGETVIRYSLDNVSDVQISIYDSNNKPVWSRSLESAEVTMGVNTITWNAKNGKGKRVSNGIYMLEIKSGNKVVIKKIAVIK